MSDSTVCTHRILQGFRGCFDVAGGHTAEGEQDGNPANRKNR